MRSLLISFTLTLLFNYFVNTCHCVTVKTRYKNITGFVESRGDFTAHVFRGVPYAKAPVGNLRFMPPVALRPMDSQDVTAKDFKPACMQDKSKHVLPFSQTLGHNETSEDCLYLNIYVPKGGSSEKHAVVVWIHGGGFQSGSGNTFDGVEFSRKSDVIVVTINYRLGVFGFLATNESSRTGNWGLLDQFMALRWIKDNIGYFGGDSDNVVILGEDTGGTSVALHVASPMSQGLFTKAISHGGMNINDYISHMPRKYTNILMAVTNCLGDGNTVSGDMKCLRSIDADELLETVLKTDVFTNRSFLPIVDGSFLVDLPSRHNSLLDDRNSTIDYLVSIYHNGRDTKSAKDSAIKIDDIVNEIITTDGQTRRSKLLSDTIREVISSLYNTKLSDSGSNDALKKSIQDYRLCNTLNMLKTTQNQSRSSSFLFVIHPTDSLPVNSSSDYGLQNSQLTTASERVLIDTWIAFVKRGHSLTANSTRWLPFNSKGIYTEIFPNGSMVSKHEENLLPEREWTMWNSIVPGILKLSRISSYQQDDQDDFPTGDSNNIPCDFERIWGMSNSQMEALLMSVVLAFLFVLIICFGLVRMVLQPPIFKPSRPQKESIYDRPNLRHVYDNEVINYGRNGQSMTSIELNENKRHFLTTL